MASLIDRCKDIRNRSDADQAHMNKWDSVLLALGQSVSNSKLQPMTAREAKILSETPGQNPIWSSVWRAIQRKEASIGPLETAPTPVKKKPLTELERLREENTYLHNTSNVAALERKLSAANRAVDQWQNKYIDLEKRLTSNTLASDYQRAQARIAQMQNQLSDIGRLTNIETSYQILNHEHRELVLRTDPKGTVMEFCKKVGSISRKEEITESECVITIRDASLPQNAFNKYHTCTKCGNRDQLD